MIRISFEDISTANGSTLASFNTNCDTFAALYAADSSITMLFEGELLCHLRHRSQRADPSVHRRHVVGCQRPHAKRRTSCCWYLQHFSRRHREPSNHDRRGWCRPVLERVHTTNDTIRKSRCGGHAQCNGGERCRRPAAVDGSELRVRVLSLSRLQCVRLTSLPFC